MCNQMANAVLGRFWLIQLGQLTLHEAPPDTDGPAHTDSEVANIVTTSMCTPVLVTSSNTT